MAEVSFWISAKIIVDEVLAKRWQALVNAGIPKTEIVKRALNLFLMRDPLEVLQGVGLKDMLEKPELVELRAPEFQPVPEAVPAATGQGKK